VMISEVIMTSSHLSFHLSNRVQFPPHVWT
jgi:hypothetical protein